MSALKLLHLSDIHFHFKTANGTYDLDADIRNELELRVKDLCKEFGGVDAILVTGDIAFCAHPKEYEVAYEWLTRIKGFSGCQSDKIWTIPGNHDIDRRKIENRQEAMDLRATLRDTQIDQLNTAFRKTLEDLKERAILLEPLEEYNKFATNLGCPSTPFHWQKLLYLNDGSELRIVGLNSTLLSDGSDDDKHDRTKLVLTGFQTDTAFTRADHAVYLSMSHHPLDWLRDSRKVEPWLDSRVRIQLFGHRHEHNVRSIAKNVRIAAGAVHPDRGEPGWEPRFNLITLEVNYNENGRYMDVQVHSQVWSDDKKAFIPDLNAGVHKEQLRLPEWQIETEQGVLTSISVEEEQAAIAAISEPTSSPDLAGKSNSVTWSKFVNAAQRMTSRYMNLPHTIQIEVAKRLGLAKDEDAKLSDIEFYRLVFTRARDQKLLEQFWAAIENVYSDHGDEQQIENPFVGK